MNWSSCLPRIPTDKRLGTKETNNLPCVRHTLRIPTKEKTILYIPIYSDYYKYNKDHWCVDDLDVSLFSFPLSELSLSRCENNRDTMFIAVYILDDDKFDMPSEVLDIMVKASFVTITTPHQKTKTNTYLHRIFNFKLGVDTDNSYILT